MKLLLVAWVIVVTAIGQDSRTASRPESRDSKQRFVNDYDTALVEAKARRVPLLIAFIVSTCANAKMVGIGLFDHDARIKLLLENFVVVTLNDDAPFREKNVAIKNGLGLSRIPTPVYVVLDPDYSKPLEHWGVLSGNPKAWRTKLVEVMETWKGAASSRRSK